MRLIASITLLFITSSFIFSQTTSANGTETDLKLLVQQQIDEVKSKETKAADNLQKEEKADPMQTALIDESAVEEKELYFKIFLLVDACFVAALIVLWRRRRANKASDAAEEDRLAAMQSKEVLEAEKKANELKAQLEKGELDGKKAGELKKIRKNLQSEAASLSLNGETVGKKAKELSISKGEIYLAARIKSQEMANECLEN